VDGATQPIIFTKPHPTWKRWKNFPAQLST